MRSPAAIARKRTNICIAPANWPGESLSEARRSVHALRPQALEEHNFWDALKGIIKNTTVGTALHTKFRSARQTAGASPALAGKSSPHRAGSFDQHAQVRARSQLRNATKLQGERTSSGTSRRRRRIQSAKIDMMVWALAGMRERVEQMGGELEITSSRGKGTKITVVLPCNGEIDVMTSKKKTAASSKKAAKETKVCCEENAESWRYAKRPRSACSSLMITALSAKVWFH